MGTIRFLLALSVIIVHSSSIFSIELVPGFLAVQSFYIISGFLMALVYNEKYLNTSKPYYYFISNRFLKLYPYYLFVIILVIGFSIATGIFLGNWGKFEYYRHYYSDSSLGSLILIMFSNFSLIGQDWITFFKLSSTGEMVFTGLQANIYLQELLFIPIAWTIAVEFTFYLISPAILSGKTYITILALSAVLILRLVLYYFFQVDQHFSIYRFAPTEFFWFLLGVLAYKLYKKKLFPNQSWGVYSLLTLTILLFVYRFLPNQIGNVLIYLSIFLFTPAIFYRFSSFRIDKYLGELCYPMYLGHAFFLLIISANHFPKTFGTGLPLFLMTLIFSIIVNRYLIQPFEKYRQSRITS